MLDNYPRDNPTVRSVSISRADVDWFNYTIYSFYQQLWKLESPTSFSRPENFLWVGLF